MPIGTTKAIASIQVLRALAALSVVLAHLHNEFANKFNMPHVLPNMDIGGAGVDLFFVISGFVIVYSSERLFGSVSSGFVFLRRRAIRIVPIYWVACFLLSGWVLIKYGSFEAVQWPLGLVVASFFFLPYRAGTEAAPFVGVGWTLYLEVFFYLIFSLTIGLSRERAVIVTAGTLVALVAANIVLPLPSLLLQYANPIIFEFIFGMMIAVAYRRGVRFSTTFVLGVVAIGLALLVVAAATREDLLPQRQIFLGIPCALIVMGAALSVPLRPNSALTLFSFLGDASYSLYLFHPFAFTLPRILLGRFLHPEGHVFFYATMLIAAAIAVGVVMHLLVERPLTTWIKGKTAR